MAPPGQGFYYYLSLVTLLSYYFSIMKSFLMNLSD